MKLVYCFHLKTNSALEVSCHTPVLQRSTFLTVLEYEVENRGKGPCYSSVLKKLEIPTMRLSSSTKPSQVALLALPSCCVVFFCPGKEHENTPEQHQWGESGSEITLICSNSRKIEQVPGSLRSWADTCENSFHRIQLVYLQNLSKPVSQKDSCLYLHALLLSTENTGCLMFCFYHLIVKYSNIYFWAFFHNAPHIADIHKSMLVLCIKTSCYFNTSPVSQGCNMTLPIVVS